MEGPGAAADASVAKMDRVVSEMRADGKAVGDMFATLLTSSLLVY